MTDPVSLNVARADKENDNRLVSPKEVLAEVLRMLEAGETEASTMVIVWAEPKDGDREKIRMQSASVNHDREIALLAAAQHFSLGEFCS